MRKRTQASAQAGEGQREKERESQAGSALSAQSLMQGLEPMNREIVTWAEIKSQPLNQLSYASTPRGKDFKKHLPDPFNAFCQDLSREFFLFITYLALVAVTNYCKLGGFSTAEMYFSQFWRLEVGEHGASKVEFWWEAS